MGPYPLDPHHSHFVLVDDGRDGEGTKVAPPRRVACAAIEADTPPAAISRDLPRRAFKARRSSCAPVSRRRSVRWRTGTTTTARSSPSRRWFFSWSEVGLHRWTWCCTLSRTTGAPPKMHERHERDLALPLAVSARVVEISTRDTWTPCAQACGGIHRLRGRRARYLPIRHVRRARSAREGRDATCHHPRVIIHVSSSTCHPSQGYAKGATRHKWLELVRQIVEEGRKERGANNVPQLSYFSTSDEVSAGKPPRRARAPTCLMRQPPA